MMQCDEDGVGRGGWVRSEVRTDGCEEVDMWRRSCVITDDVSSNPAASPASV